MTDWGPMLDGPASEQAASVTLGLAQLFDSRAHLRTRESRYLAEIDLLDPFVRPFQLVANEIPFEDLLEDVQDYAVMVALGQDTDYRLPGLVLNDVYVALLPAQGTLRRFRRMAWNRVDLESDRLRNLLDKWIAAAISDSATTMQTLDWRESTVRFLSGLTRCLAARLVSSKVQVSGEQGAGSSFASFSSPSSGSRPSSHGQWWDTFTQGEGLSIYYGGTHAVRIPANYAGGITQSNAGTGQPQLSVFLPAGTLYLAGNAGSGGSLVWDPNVVTVPSMKPSFYTKQF